MRSRFLFWSSALITSLLIIGLALRYLAEQGVSAGSSLASRGAICLLLVLLFSRLRSLPLRPKAVRVQLLRALIAGLALTLLTISFRWLSASAVAVLSNVDVPLLVALGPLVGTRASSRLRLLALLAIALLAWYGASLEPQPELWLGLLSLFGGSVLLCFGYLFIRRSMREENEAVTILTPSLAILGYGLLQPQALAWHWPALLAMSGAGLGMFLAYYCTMRLYEQAEITEAEFPTLLASLLIQPLELWILGARLEASYLVSSLSFVAVTYLLLRLQAREQRVYA